MDVKLFSEIFDFIGTLMVVYAALKVHHRFLHEHRVDENLFTTMRNEQFVAIVGLMFITLSFIVDLYLII